MQTVEQKFVKQWRQLKILPSQKVLVAVSTGVDSMVLLWLVQHLPPKLRPQIYVAYIDHQLRAQSQAETQFIQAYCEKSHLPLFVKVWQDHPKTGIENAARNVRYAFFNEIMQKEKILYLLTAHHGDDQAETFLMKLVRGGDLAQLVGIKTARSFAKNTKLVRPLLAFSKQQLADFAKEKDLFFFEDETNQSSAYFRNRIRHKIVPQLKQENPHFLSHVTEYSDQLAVLLQGCEEVAQEKLARLLTAKGYSISKLQELSLAWQELTLRQLFVENSLVLEQKQLKQVMQLLQNNTKPQGSITLNQELILKKEYDVFRLETKPKEKTTSTKKIKLQVGQWYSLGNKTKLGIFVPTEFRLNMHDEVLLVSKDSLPLYLRKRHPGDRLLTSVGHQKVKKILIDQKIPTAKRDELWCLTTENDEIFWVIGVKKTDLSPRAVNAKIQYIVVLRREVNKDEQ